MGRSGNLFELLAGKTVAFVSKPWLFAIRASVTDATDAIATDRPELRQGGAGSKNAVGREDREYA